MTEIGTSKDRFVYCNNDLLKENINEIVYFDSNGDKIIDGCKRYYFTSYTLNQIYKGLRFNVRVEYTNAQQPWNTLYTRRTFSFD